jgi:RimJ/RimL family protein N-acetyltransferase
MNLTTPRLLLRDFRLDDLAGLHQIESDPVAVKLQAYDPHSWADSERCLSAYLAQAGQADRRMFDLAMARRADGSVVGRCRLQLAASPHGEAQIGYILGRPHWGQGLMAEGLAALIGFAFETLRVRRIWAIMDARNGRSARLLEGLGMRREAHFLKNFVMKGELCDTFGYGLLSDEWTGPRGGPGLG